MVDVPFARLRDVVHHFEAQLPKSLEHVADDGLRVRAARPAIGGRVVAGGEASCLFARPLPRLPFDGSSHAGLIGGDSPDL